METPVPESEAAGPMLVLARNDAGTPAPAEGSAQAQEEASGPRVAQQKPPGPREAQQRSPEAEPVYQGNLQEKDRQTKVAEPPGQTKTGTPTRGQVKVKW